MWRPDSDDHLWEPRPGLVVGTAFVVSVGLVCTLHFTLQRRAAGSTAKVPALVGQSLSNGRALAARGGLTLVVTGSAADPLIARGDIAGQTPLAGSPVPPDRRVRVTLSEGHRASAPDRATAAENASRASSTGGAVDATTTVVVPPLTGIGVGAARRRLTEAGLRAGRVRRVSDEDRSDGIVLRQRPAPGTRVPRGSPIELTANDTDSL